MKRIIRVLLICLIVITQKAQEAICTVSVANLMGDHPDIHKPCQDLLNGPASQIKRINQLIFNERVTILEERYGAYRIFVPDHGYGTHKNKIIHHEYWVASNAITPLDELQDTQAIPPKSSNNKTITLTKPFNDRTYHRLYSLGTRFVIDSTQNKDNSIRVLLITPKLKTGHIYIPKDHTVHTDNLNIQEKIDLFIKILEDVAEQSNSYVPYVWGGNSFVKIYKNGSVTLVKATGTCTAQPPAKNIPNSGFDCASLIHRVAQTAGIPLHVKNSSGIKNVLKPLALGESVENGDLIYIPGHIITLVDTNTGMCVEARTQSHGYGYVQHISLAELFKEILNSNTLMRYHHTKKPASRLDSTGEIIRTVPITILKIRSAFEMTNESAPGRS